MIQFNCSCGQPLSAQDADADSVMQCPKCFAQMTIPTLTATQPSRPPGAAPTSAAPRDDIPRGRPRDRYGDYYEDYRRERRSEQSGMSGKALSAMILGLLSFFVPVLLSVPAIILGFKGLRDTRHGRSGAGTATAGLVMGFLTLVFGGLIGLIVVLLFAIQGVRVAAMRQVSQINMKQITLAVRIFNDDHRKLPAHAIYGKNGQPLLSWRVAILPQLDKDNLFRQFKLDEPWDSPHNINLLKQMPEVYRHPYHQNSLNDGMTYFQAFVSEDGEKGPSPLFVKGQHHFAQFGGSGLTFANTSLAQINAQDGASNTIFVVEASTAVPWTKPEDISYSANRPLPPLGIKGEQCQVGMFDTSVTVLTRNISEQTLRNAITYNDRMPLGADFFR